LWGGGGFFGRAVKAKKMGWVRKLELPGGETDEFKCVAQSWGETMGGDGQIPGGVK